LHSRIVDPSLVSIKNNVFIGPGAHISANVKIMDNVMFGPNVCILGGNHRFGEMGKSNRFLKSLSGENDKILIEEDSWIGANVVILPNVCIGFGSVVGAGCIVSRDVDPFTVVVGNPARVVRSVFTKAEIEEHLRLLHKNDAEIKAILARV